jgi:hypothetical protein
MGSGICFELNVPDTFNVPPLMFPVMTGWWKDTSLKSLQEDR